MKNSYVAFIKNMITTAVREYELCAIPSDIKIVEHDEYYISYVIEKTCTFNPDQELGWFRVWGSVFTSGEVTVNVKPL